MPTGIIIGLGSGLVSALLFYSAARGGPVLRPILLFLIPLPSLVAGLGWGWLAAVAAAVSGAIVLGVIVGGTIIVGYLLALGVPVALAAYLAYLSRPDPANAEAREWYPAGRLMAGMAMYAGALPVMLLPLIGGSYESLRPIMGEVLQQFAKRWLPPGESLPEQALAEQTEWALFLLPAGFAFQWLVMCALNLYLAGRIVLASGHLGRDWPDLTALTYPPGMGVLLGLVVLAAAAGGSIGLVGVSFTGALVGAYLLGGLALAHFIARRRAPWLVWLVYLGLFFLWPFFMPLVVLAGLLESIFQLKQRAGLSPPST
ncbi:MAG: YybS family protein [Hyphomonadaceae bacterium]|jgi:hypothetical protein|nr:YybS family protein [Hyphomonadaceae bacterium]